LEYRKDFPPRKLRWRLISWRLHRSTCSASSKSIRALAIWTTSSIFGTTSLLSSAARRSLFGPRGWRGVASIRLNLTVGPGLTLLRWLQWR
jgi:hypothetical protein